MLARPLLYDVALIKSISARSDAPFDGISSRAQPKVPRVSVILSTYNRGELLAGAVRSVLAQRAAIAPAFELIVVDNNSTDDTREIVKERFAVADGRVRYVFEPQQGLSHARNAGIRAARAPLIAFIDDDVRAQPDWVAAIVRAFDEHPEADVVGGRVLPRWPSAPPVWLTRDHWTPLALVDHGEAPIVVTAEHPICLVGSGACRRTVFDVVGFFATDCQRVKDSIGSLEDHEFLLRVLRARRKGLYDPRIIVHAEIQPNRLERAYHRRWHTGHGHFHALLRSEHMEQTRAGTLFGVPAHLYRQALGDLVGWARAKAIGEPGRAFHHEVRLRFFHGFFRTRRREFLDTPRRERRAELWRLLRRAIRRRSPLTQPETAGVGRVRQ
jgi:glycosyltransferase involved in cell wall biosynthesis